MKELCAIYNFAPHYRQSIFKLIDKTYYCHWYFGKNNHNIKKMDYSVLSGDVTEVEISYFKGLSFQHGILKLLREYDCFLITGDSRSLSTWLFLILSRYYKNKKVYLWTHGMYGKEKWVEKFIKCHIFKLSDGIFLYNNRSRNLMIELGFKSNKLHVIYNSLNYDYHVELRNKIKPSRIFQEYFKNEYCNLLFIGRLTQIKNLDMILYAMAILRKRSINVNMTFIGDGEEDEKLKLLTRQLHLENSVWFYGACYNETINAEFIYNSDLCIAPGNVGLTAVHSMVFGTPVITHNKFELQMPEFEAIIPNKTGDFFNYGEVDSLASKIQSWFKKIDYNRMTIREDCYREIDAHWNPHKQIEVLKNVI